MTNGEFEAEVTAFLLDPSNWPGQPDRVEVVETHAARVFLAGGTALKVRRPIRLPYLDFSNLEARRRCAEREIEINRPYAPEIYVGVVPLTRAPGGGLKLNGTGEVVEWAVEMHRFAQDQILSTIADKSGVSHALAIDLAEMADRYHRQAPPEHQPVDRVPATVASVIQVLRAATEPGIAPLAARLDAAAAAALEASAAVRERRTRSGYVRRCHGDLHLGNIVLIKGRPLPFDAIEFDEALATIDTLYDLAFLLMDLDRRGARTAANTVLNRYLWRTGDPADLSGLAALPLYLALRAAVRSMVALDRARVGGEPGRDLAGHARETLMRALDHLSPHPARLVAIGGLSGTGKTTLAAALSPAIGRAPGAVHLRTDLERKALAGVEEWERLPPTSYTPATAASVYDRVLERARLILEAGHSVIVDGVFAKEDERLEITDLARRTGARFDGLWLEAPAETLRARVSARRGDASDATAAVVDQQLAYPTGDIGWLRLDASGEAGGLTAAARGLLAL